MTHPLLLRSHPEVGLVLVEAGIERPCERCPTHSIRVEDAVHLVLSGLGSRPDHELVDVDM